MRSIGVTRVAQDVTVLAVNPLQIGLTVKFGDGYRILSRERVAH